MQKRIIQVEAKAMAKIRMGHDVERVGGITMKSSTWRREIKMEVTDHKVKGLKSQTLMTLVAHYKGRSF